MDGAVATAAEPPANPRFPARRAAPVVAALLGALSVAGFAPFGWWPLPVLTLALLLSWWLDATTPRQAAVLGFAWGLGYFLAGVSWVYVSLHTFGAMPAPIAAVVTLLFCAYLALFPAAAGYAAARLRGPVALKLLLLVPAAWTLLEWLRGWLFTGFPWLAVGYAQVPDGPLAGYAPVLGIYGVSLTTVATAGALALVIRLLRTTSAAGRSSGFATGLATLVLLWGGGWGLKHVEWTQPVGEPVTVSLIQGNIAQDLKWREDRLRSTLALYRDAVLAAEGQLIILPETALPLFLRDVPADYLAELAAHAKQRQGNVLIGVPERLPQGEYYNSVVSLGADAMQVYRKVHLVPFGEFIPLRPVLAWIVNILSIPLQDFSRGAVNQRPLTVSGQQVAVNVCYEDAFGEEIIRQLPQATLLVNVSNVAWFGRSIAPQQHLQISQARALETGRPMLRATNTGMTAIVDVRGRIERVAPEFSAATLTHSVRGHAGVTPYVRWGNLPALALCGLLVAACCLVSHYRLRND